MGVGLKSALAVEESYFLRPASKPILPVIHRPAKLVTAFSAQAESQRVAPRAPTSVERNVTPRTHIRYPKNISAVR